MTVSRFKLLLIFTAISCSLVGWFGPGQLQAEIGQMIPLGDETVKAGDIIIRDRQTGRFLLADRPNLIGVYGVVVENPQMVLGSFEAEGVSVMRSGQVLVNVTTIGGDIVSGDYLTTSRVPGHGRRAGADHGNIIGVAQEPFSEDQVESEITDSPAGEVVVGQISVALKIGPLEELAGLEPVPVEKSIRPDDPEAIGLRELLEDNYQTVRQLVDTTLEVAGRALQTAEGQIISYAVAGTGVLVGGVSVINIFMLNPGLLELYLLPFRILTLLQSWFGFRDRPRAWGTVYDSETKQPLDPVYVILTDPDGKELKTSITDMNGRYGFLVEPGRYRLKAHKSNYRFPSEKLVGQQNDEMYDSLYFGDIITVEPDETVVARDIPMDSERFDWNEFTKQSKQGLVFFSYMHMIKQALSRYFFYLGFLVAVLLLVIMPYWYNFLIVGLYLMVSLFRLYGWRKRSYGRVKEAGSRAPVPFPLVFVHLVKDAQPRAKVAGDKYGRYFVLVANGQYYVTIHRKRDDGEYYRCHTSDVFQVKNGMINRTFKV